MWFCWTAPSTAYADVKLTLVLSNLLRPASLGKHSQVTKGEGGESGEKRGGEDDSHLRTGT